MMSELEIAAHRGDRENKAALEREHAIRDAFAAAGFSQPTSDHISWQCGNTRSLHVHVVAWRRPTKASIRALKAWSQSQANLIAYQNENSP